MKFDLNIIRRYLLLCKSFSFSIPVLHFAQHASFLPLLPSSELSIPSLTSAALAAAAATAKPAFEHSRHYQLYMTVVSSYWPKANVKNFLPIPK